MGTLKTFDLQTYITKYEIDTFIETGTYLGDSLQYAAHFKFENLYSIEIFETYYKKCVDRFKPYNNVHLINDNSIDGLASIMPRIVDKRCIFWLDAHLPDHYDKGTKYDNDYSKNENFFIPLKQELQSIVNSKNVENDVFIIDDLRIYETGNFQSGNWNGYLKHPNSVYGTQFVNDVLGNTHDIVKDYRNEGYIICTPKIK